MPYIYKITNINTNKVYIGKTSRTIQERWKEHCKQFNQDALNRPLYNAMKKYGVDNFLIEVVEECDESILSIREQYWIDAYNSYYNGYNATLGGDGRPCVNSQLVYDLFNEGKLVKEIVELTGYSKPTVIRILNSIDENGKIRMQRGHLKTSTAVVMVDKNTNQDIRAFSSANEATKFCKGKGHSHILEVCKGKRKTAYGYKWRFLEA